MAFGVCTSRSPRDDLGAAFKTTGGVGFSVFVSTGLTPPYMKRVAIVGPARPSTVEKALHLAGAPEDLRAEIRADKTVRRFIEGALAPESNGYHIDPFGVFWNVCIASIHEVIR